MFFEQITYVNGFYSFFFTNLANSFIRKEEFPMKNVVCVLCVVFSALSFVGCSKDEAPTNSNNNNNTNTTHASATIDGSSTFSIPIGASSMARGYYIKSENAVTCVFSDGAKSLSVNVFGGTTGSFPFLEDGNTEKRWAQISLGNSLSDMSASIAGEGSVTITKFGAVGEKIEGTFSGKFMTFKGEMKVVTNGTFSAIRAEDID